MTINSTHYRFQWLGAALKAILFILKNRIKAPRVLPAPPTGDAITDETTRREFERVKEQLNADYQDQRALLNDLEPLLTELAEQLQGWMNQRDEMFNAMIIGSARAALPAPVAPAPVAPAAPAVGALPGTGSAQEFLGNNTGASYEGQLVRGDGTQAVYKIESGKKRWIVSQPTFERLGYRWEDVKLIPRQIVDNIPFGTNIG
jgi:hypothetical protein